VVRRATAERAGKRLDQRSALFCVVVGGKVTDTEECVDDLDASNEFWSSPTTARSEDSAS
jgi:hypothetical protein